MVKIIVGTALCTLGIIGGSLIPSEAVEEEVVEKLEDISITPEALNHVLEFGSRVLEQNSDITDEELDAIMFSEMSRLSATKGISTLSSDDDYYGGMNKAELKLALQHPSKALKVKKCAEEATERAKAFYSSGLSLGNGDAFRHAYWNALMVKEIGSKYAKKFADAHEAYTPEGLDKTMDLNNNAKGRSLGEQLKSNSYDYIAERIKTYVSNGYFERIVNNELVKTNSEGLK